VELNMKRWLQPMIIKIILAVQAVLRYKLKWPEMGL